MQCSRARLWTVLRDVYDSVRFYSGKEFEFRSSLYDMIL